MMINGKKVVDATRSLKIAVNEDDARLGKNRNPSQCAAARAIMRAYQAEGAKQARVHIGRVYIEYPDKWVRYLTSEALKTEIVSFDRGATAKYMVGEYTLYKPSADTKLGASKKYKGDPRIGNRKRKRMAHIHHHIEGIRERGANK